MSDLSRINRKIKAAMKRFIEQDDPDALGSIHRLARQREKYLLSLSAAQRKTEKQE
jgi:hypothetical protein